MRYAFKAKVWAYGGPGGWRFVTLPKDVSGSIRALTPRRGPGFGSVRVIATLGDTTWSTSLFPDSKAGAFLLPIKASVRQRERIKDDDRVDVSVEISL